MIFTILHYFIFSSAVLIYGIGLNNATIICDEIQTIKLNFIKIILSVLFSTVISWIIIQNFLIPLNITELYPIISFLVFITISIFLESMIRITTKKITSDFNFSFLIVLLALSESINIIDVILISISSIMSLIILLPILKVIKNKINMLGNTERHCNKKSLILISIAIIIIILSTGNISWLNPGVIK